MLRFNCERLSRKEYAEIERKLELHSGQVLRCFPESIRKRFISFKMQRHRLARRLSPQEIVNALRVDRTWFFRDLKQFNAFERHFIKNPKPRRSRVKVLCVGASTGEEPYSILLLLRSLRAQCSIDCIDVNSETLAFAALGRFRKQKALKEIPARYRLWESEEGAWIKIQPQKGEQMRFLPGNILKMKSFPEKSYDYIFCRNVMYYFSPANKQRLLKKLSQRLSKKGILFVGKKDL